MCYKRSEVKILVTAGPTREAIDPVRFISNRSSGKMGYAVAEVAAQRGHDVCLVSGPTQLAVPEGVTCENVVSAADMLDAVVRHLSGCEALVMTAAVADWRPCCVHAQKIKKSGAGMSIELERTPDILLSISDRKGDRVFVGFAAETGDPVPEAHRKCRAKSLDLVVANDVSVVDAGFGSDNNRVTFVTLDGTEQTFPLQPKRTVAANILDWIESHRTSA